MTAPKQKALPSSDGPDTVCHHSGLPPAECDYRCTSCRLSFVPCPDREEIYRRAAALRDKWPQWHLDKQENREWNLEIPTATKVSDHMRRRASHDQS